MAARASQVVDGEALQRDGRLLRQSASGASTARLGVTQVSNRRRPIPTSASGLFVAETRYSYCVAGMCRIGRGKANRSAGRREPTQGENQYPQAGNERSAPKSVAPYPHRLRIEYSPRPAPKEGTVIGDGPGRAICTGWAGTALMTN